MICPRRKENGALPGGPFWREGQKEDSYRNDDTCSYCGSLSPDVFMTRLEAGDVELEPTDKNYKVYVNNLGGTPFKQTYRDCPADDSCKGPDTCTHWVTRETTHTKFYFQHLSPEQQKRFIELHNDKKLLLAEPGYFYIRPFFANGKV